jgi:hypothetical protein
MLRMLPNWFYGMLPADLWPDQPREFYCYTLSLIPLTAGAQSFSLVFSKKTDTLIFGGHVIRTESTAPFNLINPRSGVSSRALVQLSNAAGNEVYTDGNVPLENIFSVWGPIMGDAGFVNVPAKLPCVWPLPITVRKGGELTMRLTDLAPGADSWFRFTFYGALVYQQREAA